MIYKALCSTCLLLGFILVFSGCGNKEKTNTPVVKEEPVKIDKHPETKKLEAASAVGYDGTAIRKKVDGLIDKTEENNKKLEDMENK